MRIQEPCDRRCFEKKEETFRPPSPEVEEIKLTWIRPPCPDSIKITGCGVEIKHCCAPKKKTHESDEVLNAEDEASVTVSEQKAIEEGDTVDEKTQEGEQDASVLENEEGAVNEEN